LDETGLCVDTTFLYEEATVITETFIANNPKDAYNDALDTYGSTITLISAKQVESTQSESSHFEVTVGIHDEIYEAKALSILLKEAKEEDKHEEQVLLSEVDKLKEELALMKKKMTCAQRQSVLDKVKELFRQKGISDTWLEPICEILYAKSMMETSILEDDTLLISYILAEMDATLKIKEESLNESKIIMIVGPTGVGKTTTIAKLAARYTYMMDKSYKVGFINLDNYKIGAFDQLGHFAEVMDIKHLPIDNVQDFIEGLKVLTDYDVLFIDTTGMSPYDTQRFIRTVEFVQSDMDKKLEVNLVLPATIKYEDMHDIYNNFSFLNLNSVIISKFDETKYLGTLLNFMLLYKIPMSYFSIGQEVPDDLIVASKEYLLERFIDDLSHSS